MTKDKLLRAANVVASQHPEIIPRLEKAGNSALSFWVNATHGAREAACEVAIEVQLIAEIHGIAWRKQRGGIA